jgi:hypothetical protein
VAGVAGPEATVVAATAEPALAPRIRIGPFSLVNGTVDFADRFIRPNYRANLTDLTGRLGGFSSEGAQATNGETAAPQMADLELRGRAEGTASLQITGKLNPLATPLALDIEGRVRDLELPPLSPYTIKYTGHGIERGKLSLDVAYTVLPNGQLTARNQLTLNQLTFGEPVAGAPASLPVKLATALLADRHGVIDLNLRHTALNVTILDTLVAILAGVVIFPAVFSVGIEPSSGPSLVFITLPSIFNGMPLSMVWSSIFFLLLVVAALTSTISLHEVVTVYLHEEWHLSRKAAAWLTTAATAALASLASLSLGVLSGWTICGLSLFDSLDFLTANILLPAGGFFTFMTEYTLKLVKKCLVNC